MADDLVDDLPVAQPKKDLQPDTTNIDLATRFGQKADTVDAMTPAVHAPMSGDVHDAIATNGSYSRVLNAFGQGFAHEWGSAQFGPELKKTLEDAGILYNGKGDPTVAKAFGEAFIRPAANALDVALRTASGVFTGVHDASVEGGENIAKPLGAPAAMMEAFPLAGAELGRLGWAPGKLRKPDLRVAQDMGVIGPERPALSEGDAATAAKNAIQPVTAYHGSPYSFDAFSMDKIGTGEGAQVYGHGLYFAEHPEVARNYKEAARLDTPQWDKLTYAEHEIATKMGKFETQQEAADFLEKNSTPDQRKNIMAAMEQPAHEYQVRLHVNKDAMLDWDAPASQQPAGLKQAYKDAGLDLTGATTGEDAYHQLVTKLGSKEAASKALQDAGVPGIKYLDQQSRGTDQFVILYDGENYFVDKKMKGRIATFKSREEAEAFISTEAPRTHNIVMFDDKAVEITHKNGEPVSAPVPATNPDYSLVKRSEPGPVAPVDQNPWQTRFDEYVTKLKVPDDVKNLIRNAAAENGAFPEARAGEIPAEHLGRLSDITGVPVSEMPEAKMRLTMRNDAEFRTAAQIMIKTNDDVFEAARSHRAEGSFSTRQELVAAIMRRDLALEQVVGLRAEWGRTGNVMQEFLDNVKDAQGLGRFIKDHKGDAWDSAKLDDVAEKLGSMNNREDVGAYLTAMRKPTFMDKAIWYWTNSILSGPITHSKYMLANAAYIAHDTLIATPLAGISGAVRQALSSEQIERVYLGETVMKMYGTVAGVKDALYAAGQAMKTSVPTSLAAQVRGAGETNPITGLRPINGITGTVIGAPSRVIAGIHSFYNFLGYRAELEAQAYRKAVKMGYSPLKPDFWKAQKDLAYYPDDPMIDAGILAGQRANFVQDLGPAGKATQAFLYKTQIGRFIAPFVKVPGNIANAFQEGTPLAFLDERMRSDLLGKNGGPARDMANGRLAAGSAVMGAAALWTLKDEITGNGPVNPKERAEWLLTHQPRSFKFNGRWVSYDRFGPVGGWLALAADATDATQAAIAAQDNPQLTETQKKQHEQDMTEAYSRVVIGFTKWVEEAGYEGLFNLVEAMSDPSKSRASNAGSTAATALPFSSGQSQVASFMDPYMRDTQTFLDGVRRAIPGQREMLPVARDWSGAPRPNPGYHSLLKTIDVNDSFLDKEMQRLDIKPTKPDQSIRGVRLSREQYDEFQTLAGTNTREQLKSFTSQPMWAQLPDYGKVQLIDKVVKASRRQAEAAMQSKYPNLINEGVDNRLNDIFGQKKKPTAYQRP